MLACPRSRQQAAWTQALHEVCGRQRRQLFDLGPPDCPSFGALVPVAVDGLCRALVTLGRGELCGVLELQMFAPWPHRRGALVLRKLVLGLKPAEIAVSHGVAPSTVLTQVAAIRSKTGSSSVRALLSTLSRLPAVMPVPLGGRPPALAGGNTTAGRAAIPSALELRPLLA